MQKSTKIIIKLIGVYQIIGGLFGFYSLIKSVNQLDNLGIWFLVITLFFSFSIISGIYLLAKKWMERGIKLSLINQYMQIARIKLLGYGYYYSTGIVFGIGYSDTPNDKLIFEFKYLASKVFFYLGDKANEINILINVIPIFLVILLTRINKMK